MSHLAGFNRVKNWTKKIDFFSKEYIFIPINEDNNWALAVVCNPGMVLDAVVLEGGGTGKGKLVLKEVVSRYYKLNRANKIKLSSTHLSKVRKSKDPIAKSLNL